VVGVCVTGVGFAGAGVTGVNVTGAGVGCAGVDCTVVEEPPVSSVTGLAAVGFTKTTGCTFSPIAPVSSLVRRSKNCAFVVDTTTSVDALPTSEASGAEGAPREV